MLVLEHSLAPALSPLELVAEAVRLEIEEVSVLLKSAPNFTCGHDLTTDRAGRVELSRRLAGQTMRVACALPFFITPRRPVAEHRSAVAAAADIGARGVLLLAYGLQGVALVSEVAAFAELAARSGLEVYLEPFGASAVPSLESGVRLLGEVGASNLALCADVLHLTRSGASIPSIARAAASIAYAQLCDGPLQSALGLVEEALWGRLAPGEGEFPLAEFRRALRASTRTGVEVPSALTGKEEQRAHLREVMQTYKGFVRGVTALS